MKLLNAIDLYVQNGAPVLHDGTVEPTEPVGIELLREPPSVARAIKLVEHFERMRKRAAVMALIEKLSR